MLTSLISKTIFSAGHKKMAVEMGLRKGDPFKTLFQNMTSTSSMEEKWSTSYVVVYDTYVLETRSNNFCAKGETPTPILSDCFCLRIKFCSVL